MPDGSTTARPEPAPPRDQQLPLPFSVRAVERPPVAKVYREGFRITVSQVGVLIETVDYHAKPLFLDAMALRELGLGLQLHEEQERSGPSNQ